MNHREIGYVLLRAILGVIFVTTGTMKFIAGLSNFVGTMNQRFSGKLPAAMVMPFAYLIPFCEVIAGTLILIGLFTMVGLTVSGLLLIGLTFGMVVLGDPATVAHNLQYALINFVLLAYVDLNRYSLDGLLGRKSPAGFTQT
jgi:thiosulfate dehydrogenase (quinone) large subunit